MLARLRWSCSAARWLSSSRAFLVSLRILSSSWLRIYTSRRFIASTCRQRLLKCPELRCRAIRRSLPSPFIVSRGAHGTCMHIVQYSVLESHVEHMARACTLYSTVCLSTSMQVRATPPRYQRHARSRLKSRSRCRWSARSSFSCSRAAAACARLASFASWRACV